MDRATVYTQEQGRSVDFLFAQRSTMIGLGKMAQAAFGSNTVVRGLAVTPNSPAALNVLVGIGEIYTVAAVDATAWGALTADTTDMIVKQGLNMSAQTISTPAPSTSGYSINYLIEAQYQDQDTNSVVLPYYNSNNPQIPLNGQGGNGAPQATQRQGLCIIQAKAGIAAATGTQTTPSVDSGWTAIAVVTVANGQSTVTASNISIPAGVPQITSLLQMMQTGSTVYAVDTSTTANTITLALTPAVTAYGDGNPICFKAANSNTGPCTINWGGGSIALNGANGALQGGEIIAGKQYEVVYNSTTGTAVLIGQSGGALQVPPATASQHAVQLGQVAGVVGSVRNLKCYLATAGTSLTYTADEIVVESALGGLRYCLSSFNQTLNGATTGLGGLDTGAIAANTYYAIYAARTSAGASGIFAQVEPAGGATSVYQGTHLPAGAIATGLVGVWLTNGSAQFIPALQIERSLRYAITVVTTGSAPVASFTALNISGVVPQCATKVSGTWNYQFTAGGSGNLFVQMASSPGGFGPQTNGQNLSWPAAGGPSGSFNALPIAVTQTLYYTFTGGTGTFGINVCGYDF